MQTSHPDLNRCERAEQACAHALQILPESEVAAAETHIASCPDCRRELESLRAVVGRFVSWPTDVLRPPTSLQGRLALRIAEETGKQPVPPPARQWSEPEWEQVAPGIECKLLAADTERHRVSMLVRLAPGASYPAHTHAGVEELHLLDGELWIDGRELVPGDYNYGAPGAVDERVWSETGCTCVLITSTKDVMRLVNIPYITRCGLPGIEHVPFGMHACHFYRNRNELVAAMVPYFIAGLRENERCLWITAPPLPAHEASQALRAASDGVDDAIQAGALRILDFDQWYGSLGRLKGLDVIQFWLEEEERALAEGYNGLRITGNTSFLTPGDWPTFMEYEQALSARFHGRRILTICSYARARCNDQQTSEVMHAHHCAFERPDTDWQVIAASEFSSRAG